MGDKLFLHGKLVPSLSIKEGLLLFANWLSSFEKEVILIGHNIRRFDIKHLLRHIKENELSTNFNIIAAFVDTLPMLKQLFPQEISYSQQNLYRSIIGGTYDAHNALSDVQALAEILHLPVINTTVLHKFSIYMVY